MDAICYASEFEDGIQNAAEPFLIPGNTSWLDKMQSFRLVVIQRVEGLS